jgi:hypothetical protein
MSAQNYYQNGEQHQQYAPPQGQPQYQPGGQQYDPKYQQGPPTYDANYGYGPTNYNPTGEKQDFNQAFKLERPRWNDLWAGVLVRSHNHSFYPNLFNI